MNLDQARRPAQAGCSPVPPRRAMRHALALLSGFVALSAGAQDGAEPEARLTEVEVVSAPRSGGAVSVTRSGGDVDDSPFAISVVDSATLAERPAAAGVQGVLAEQPGIQFARSGGLGGQIVLRGFNSNSSRSIVTLDGDRYQGRNTLEFNLFDADAIERIEVIRGAASSLYGADAMNGVVNIISRRARVDPRQPEFQLTPHLRSVGVASVNDMVGARVELEGGGRGWDVLIGANARSASDYDTPLGRARNSHYRAAGLDLNVGFSPEASPHRSRWELSGRYQDVSTGRAGGIGAAPGEPVMRVSEDPIIERYLRLGYQGRNFGALADSLDVSLYRRDFKTDIYQISRANPTVTAMPHLKVYTPVIWGGHVTAQKGVGEHLLSYGMDFSDEGNVGRYRQITRVNPETGAVIGQTGWEHIDRTRRQDNVGVYAADQWQATQALTLSGGLRGDWVRARIGREPAAGENAAITAAFGDRPGARETALTGSLGAVWKLSPVWSLTTNFGRGFRAPAGELTTTGTAGTINNLPAPNLKPEYSNMLELGVRWHGQGQRGSLTAYTSRYTDLIVNERIDSANFQRQNVGKAEINGLELEGESRLAARWMLRYMLTATRGTNQSSNKPLPYIAPLVTRLALRYDTGSWYGEGVVRGYQGKTRIDASQERKSPGYGMVDLYAGGKLSALLGPSWQGWRLTAGVENLFNRLGRNPVVYEDIAYPWGSVANPLVEPGRNFVLKMVAEY